MYFVYILESTVDHTFYIGYTSNIKNRLFEHNFGRTGYTKLKRPWKLVYFEQYATISEARIRENYLKKLKSKTYLYKLIKNYQPTGS